MKFENEKSFVVRQFFFLLDAKYFGPARVLHIPVMQKRSQNNGS
jgi:hypothetical protein